jgi:hypothetical protein
MTTLSTQESRDLEQMQTFLALAHLAKQGLPKLEWRITDAGEAYGHVNIPGHDRDARAAINAYATFLHATVQEEQHDNQHVAWTHLYVGGMYRDVPVGVWTHVGHRPVSRTDVA